MEQQNDKCPKCGAALAEITTTATGRKLQRCSTGSWNPQTHKNEGCEYVKWLEVEPKELDEKCPKCGEPLVLFTTAAGKKMKKCSTAGWDREAKKATGCEYVLWLKAGQTVSDNGEEFLPPEE